MPKVNVLDLNNKIVGEIELSDSVFAADVNEALLYEAVRNYLANQRQRHRVDQDSARSSGLG